MGPATRKKKKWTDKNCLPFVLLERHSKKKKKKKMKTGNNWIYFFNVKLKVGRETRKKIRFDDFDFHIEAKAHDNI